MLTVPEAARRTRRNPETIRRWIREGKLPASKVGTQHVIEEDALEALLQGRLRVAAQPGPTARPFLVRASEAVSPPGPATPGMDRRTLIEQGDRWVGWVRTDAGLAGGWHHHAGRDSYVYILRGTVTLEYGADGMERLTAHAGDVVFNPARLIHREITGPGEPAELLVVRVGEGPLTVNVEGPEAPGPASSGSPSGVT